MRSSCTKWKTLEIYTPNYWKKINRASGPNNEKRNLYIETVKPKKNIKIRIQMQLCFIDLEKAFHRIKK